MSARRRGGISGLLATALLAGALVSAPVGPATGTPTAGSVAAGAAEAVIAPQLLADVARAPAPAILSWDRTEATHEEVTTYLHRAGVRAHVFEALPAAVTCLASPRDVQTMAAAPGALSVWGEEPLIPTLDESRQTIFDGEENLVYDTLGLSGEGVGIGVVDSGVDGTHPDLEGKVRSNVRVVVSHREIMGSQDPPPCQDVYTQELPDSELTSGHGTHMASIAAGSGAASDGRLHGVAPGAQLIAAGVTDSTNLTMTDPTRNVTLSLLGAIGGFNHILLYGLGSPIHTKAVIAGWTAEGLHDPYHPVYLAARDLWHFDMLVVFPTGNGGPETSDCSAAESCTFNPFAVGPYVMAVGATPKRSRTELTDFSSRGDPLPHRTRGQEVAYAPSLVAPGVQVSAARRPGTASVGTLPGAAVGAGGSPTEDQTSLDYVALTGTSVAAAHVAGAVALIQEDARKRTGCFLRVSQMQYLLADTASAMAGYEPWEVGAGALDVVEALTEARELTRSFSPDPWICPR